MMDYQDSAWIHETLAGNTRSFDNIVIKYQDRIYTFILNTVKDKPDAEELTQNVFINAFSGLKSFKGESSLSTWLYGIAINQIKNYKRKKRNKREYAESEINKTIRNGIHDLFDSLEDSKAIKSEEAKRLVDELLSILTFPDKEIFILYYLIGHTCEEIAEIFKTSTAKIKIRLFRGRKYIISKIKNFL